MLPVLCVVLILIEVQAKAVPHKSGRTYDGYYEAYQRPYDMYPAQHEMFYPPLQYGYQDYAGGYNPPIAEYINAPVTYSPGHYYVPPPHAPVGIDYPWKYPGNHPPNTQMQHVPHWKTEMPRIGMKAQTPHESKFEHNREEYAIKAAEKIPGKYEIENKLSKLVESSEKLYETIPEKLVPAAHLGEHEKPVKEISKDSDADSPMIVGIVAKVNRPHSNKQYPQIDDPKPEAPKKQNGQKDEHPEKISHKGKKPKPVNKKKPSRVGKRPPPKTLKQFLKVKPSHVTITQVPKHTGSGGKDDHVAIHKDKMVKPYKPDILPMTPVTMKVIYESASTKVHKNEPLDNFDEPEVVEALVKVEEDYDEPLVVEALSKKEVMKHQNEEYNDPNVVEVLKLKEHPNQDYDTPKIVEILKSKQPHANNHKNEEPDYYHNLVGSVDAHSTPVSTKKDVSFLGVPDSDQPPTVIVNSAAFDSKGSKEVSTETINEILYTEQLPGTPQHIKSVHPLSSEVLAPLNLENIGLDHLTFEDMVADKVAEMGSAMEDEGPISPRFFPINPNAGTLMSNVQSEERRKFKNCTTSKNDLGNCMPVQTCSVTNVASNVEELLKNVCVIDEVFIGVCCPEFPVEIVKVNWGKTEDLLLGDQEVSEVSKECGKLPSVKGKIFWPWMASLISTTSEKIFCTGVLVNDQYILTAAHCTTRIPRNQILARLTEPESGNSASAVFPVLEIKRHAGYSPRTMQNDLALLKLAKKVSSGQLRRSICLPNETKDYVDVNAVLLRQDESFEASDNDTTLPVVSNKDCRKKMGSLIKESMLCAEPTAEIMCNADSGAPLVVAENGTYQMIGILTWNRNDCDGRVPLVFTRVSSFSNWVKKHAGADLLKD